MRRALTSNYFKPTSTPPPPLTPSLPNLINPNTHLHHLRPGSPRHAAPRAHTHRRRHAQHGHRRPRHHALDRPAQGDAVLCPRHHPPPASCTCTPSSSLPPLIVLLWLCAFPLLASYAVRSICAFRYGDANLRCAFPSHTGPCRRGQRRHHGPQDVGLYTAQVPPAQGPPQHRHHPLRASPVSSHIIIFSTILTASVGVRTVNHISSNSSLFINNIVTTATVHQ